MHFNLTLPLSQCWKSISENLNLTFGHMNIPIRYAYFSIIFLRNLTIVFNLLTFQLLLKIANRAYSMYLHKFWQFKVSWVSCLTSTRFLEGIRGPALRISKEKLMWLQKGSKISFKMPFPLLHSPQIVTVWKF